MGHPSGIYGHRFAARNDYDACLSLNRVYAYYAINQGEEIKWSSLEKETIYPVLNTGGYKLSTKETIFDWREGGTKFPVQIMDRLSKLEGAPDFFGDLFNG